MTRRCRSGRTRPLRWIVVDSGNVVGPEGKQFYDIVESTNAAPTISKVAAAPVSGAVDVTFNKLPADGDNPVNAYRVQAYTGTSADVATGVRVGDPVNVRPARPTRPSPRWSAGSRA